MTARERSSGGPILAIETSCDDTCVALVSWEGEILSNVISSQEVHSRFGGVVPEVASRHHLELLEPALEEALARAGATLEDVGLVAATRGPGLVGALLVGFSAAKALAAARELPFAAVDHLHGHMAASFLRGEHRDGFAPPFLCLIASGGHTLLADVRDPGPHLHVLGQTLDDAAGEAFDKGARLLGLGYPGGAALERLARDGDPEAFGFPSGRRMPGLDFSFAGLKTALLYKVRDLGAEQTEARRADLAASFQRAIVEALVLRVTRALRATGASRLAVGGGVAANGPLRQALAELEVELDIPPRALCTDNAAMIASAARYTPAMPFPSYLSLDVYASGERSLVA
jgi:N6-L-threonylcarbamoyladenine synthase